MGSRPSPRRGDEGERVKDPTAQERLEILRATRSVAIIGMSTDPSRASYFVATYLLSSSCEFEHVWFVNPKGGETLGQQVYPSLDVAARGARPRRRVPPRRRPAGGRRGGRRHPRHPHVLGQLGLRSEKAAEIAAGAGLAVVMNRCLKIEHARFAGGLHLAGFDTGVITSRRRLTV